MFFWRSGGSTPTSLESRQSSSCWPGASTAASWPGPARATRGTSPSLLGNAPLPLSNAAFHLPLHPDPFGSSALKINRFLFWMWRVGRISLTVYMNSSFVFQNDWNLRDAVIQLYWCLMKKAWMLTGVRISLLLHLKKDKPGPILDEECSALRKHKKFTAANIGCWKPPWTVFTFCLLVDRLHQ